MGVSIGRSQWAYELFAVFRRELAKLEGITLGEMHGYRTEGTSWDEVNTPLRPLLDHPDNDGDLSPEECTQVWPRLAFLAPLLSSEYDRINGAGLAEDMRKAAESGQRLEFR